ncbi:FecR family protein [Parabacteroides chinchillae]
MNSDKKDILKKLMHESLNKEEETALINRPEISGKMLCQWDSYDGARFSEEDGSRIWGNIRKRINGKISKQVVFYKIYSLVASVVLVLGLGGAIYFADREPAPLMFVASSGIKNFEPVSLPDGTEVQMGPGSKIVYPEKFSGKNREVALEGQAFFDVAKNPGKPFIVHTPDMKITALGTAFEVFSYKHENKHEIILLNGKVKIGVNNEKHPGNKEVELLPNEMFVYDKWNKTASVRTVDADKYSTWRNNGILSFENEKLNMIIPRLEQWFGRKIICQKNVADSYRFTFKVRDESLERILYILSKSSPIRYVEMNGDYKLYLEK